MGELSSPDIVPLLFLEGLQVISRSLLLRSSMVFLSPLLVKVLYLLSISSLLSIYLDQQDPAQNASER